MQGAEGRHVAFVLGHFVRQRLLSIGQLHVQRVDRVLEAGFPRVSELLGVVHLGLEPHDGLAALRSRLDRESINEDYGPSGVVVGHGRMVLSDGFREGGRKRATGCVTDAAL